MSHSAGRFGGSRFRLFAQAKLLAVALLLAPLQAGFHVPVRLTGGGGSASQPDLGLANTSFLVALVEDGRILLQVANGGSTVVAEPAGLHSHPRLAVGELGRISILFVAPALEPSKPGELGLWVVDRESGAFGLPREVANGFAVPPDHAAAYNKRGGLDLLWAEEQPAAGPPSIKLSKGSMPAEGVGNGERAQMAEGPLGFTHLAYLRDGTAFYRSDRLEADFSSEEEIVGVSGVRDIALAVDEEERAHLVLEAASGLVQVTVSARTVSEPVLVAEVGSAPRLTVGRDGALGVAFLRDGLLLFTQKQPGAAAFEPAVEVSPVGGPVGGPAGGAAGPQASDDHELKSDALGYYHIVFGLGGEIFYSNDIPPPKPLFRPSVLEVSQGQDVAFEDLSEGAISGWEWDFGDGEGSSEPSPRHAYRKTGRYVVSLTTRGPGGAQSYKLPEKIQVLPAPNILRIPRMKARPGDVGLMAPVLLSSKISSGGFQVVLAASKNLHLKLPVMSGTLTEDLKAEFIDAVVEPNLDSDTLLAAVLWDYRAPFDGRLLPPVKEQALLFLKFDIAADAEGGSVERLHFANHYGPQDRSNLIVSGAENESVFPFTEDGVVDLVDSQGGLFLRGDSNRDFEVGLSDAVFTLVYLFNGEGEPPCPDAADSNDDGDIDVSDPIDTLSFLFSGVGKFPPYPYPGAGLDGTEDELPPCGE
jgi:PKD repeat protein